MPPLKSPRRRLTKPVTIVAVALALLLAVLVVVGGLNALDADPSPEALRLLATPGEVAASAPPPERNGYAWTLGLIAPVQVDAKKWGADYLRHLERIAALQQSRYRNEPVHEQLAEEQRALDAHLKPVLAADKPWCPPEVEPCLPLFRARRAALRAEAAQHRLLVKRAAEIVAAPSFAETYVQQDLDAPMPHLQGILNTQQAAFALALGLLEDGAPAAAIEILKSDLALQRRILGQSASLLHKIIGNAGVARNLVLAHELLEQPTVSAADRHSYLLAATRPLTAAESSLKPAFEREALGTIFFFSRGFSGLSGAPSPGEADNWSGRAKTALGSLFYQPNRTIRCVLEPHRAALAIDAAGYAGFGRAMQRYVSDVQGQQERRWTERIVNPIGHTLCRVAQPNFAHYVARQRDLEVLRQAVVLALQDGATPPSGINPYTGQPFEIDAQKRQLRFQPATTEGWVGKLARRNGGWIAIGY
jgi:hypothetical protein